MEVIKVVGKDSQGLFQRILVELGRRKIVVEKTFMARSDDLQTVIIEANTGNMNGRLLHALMALQDVNTAEYAHGGLPLFLGVVPRKKLGLPHSMRDHR